MRNGRGIISLIAACLVVGVLGAFVGNFLGTGIAYITDAAEASSIRVAKITAPAGRISGFVLCYVLSLVFLRLMSKRDWKSGFGLGTLFGGLAGAASGMVTGIADSLAWHHTDAGNLVFGGVFAAFVGTIFGALIALAMTLLFGRFVLRRFARKQAQGKT